MKPALKKEILRKIDNCLEDIICEIENNRFEPSERGAGTAPKDSAIDYCKELFFNLINDISEHNISKGDLEKVLSIEEIIEQISNLSSEEFDNFDADDYDELEEIDTFNRDGGERKYIYVNNVYKHKPSGRFICIEYQQSSNPEYDFKALQSVAETKKKEKITYNWE